MTKSPLFRKVLVANRGEIALRVMRACHDLGISTVGIYGDGELNAPHVRYAREAVRLSSDVPMPYLDIKAIVDIAVQSGASAIHPGYGFLAENAEFARSCQAAGIVFIGPPPDAISRMGDKIAAREVAIQSGVPFVPGSDGPVDLETARAFGDRIGYPLALKAAAGGGGRGFRVAASHSEIEDAFNGATGEATRYFGDGRVYVERYLDQPRHIEIQIFADQHGGVVALGERDCSIQRRHQKLIEESPSPAITNELRDKMSAAAVKLARAVGYQGAGTVEFLFQGGQFFFLEMNTRIQVEHPVTEMVTGIDLVAEQVRIAAGEPLSFGPDVELLGHAVECRINAEDPSRGFTPTPGTITSFAPPSGFGVRLDSAAGIGYEIHPQYDSLVGKLITWGRTRTEALNRMSRSLEDFSVLGVPTTIDFHRRVIAHPSFRDGDYSTGFLSQYPDVLEGLASGQTELSDGSSEDASIPENLIVEVDGKRFDVRVYSTTQRSTKSKRPPLVGRERGTSSAGQGKAEIVSPIQGTVLSVAVSAGDHVRNGDLICVIEAMKMENEIKAPHDGMVRRLDVVKGQSVRAGAVLVIVDPVSS